MKLSEIKDHLAKVTAVNFRLEDGTRVPEHFHVTEVGVVTREFIDCGGKVRTEGVANFQLWDADDYEHRLKPRKLLNIIALSERILGMQDSEIEVEYEQQTIGRYGLEFDGTDFILTAKQTACLAEDACGIPVKKQTITVTDNGAEPCCNAEGNCC